MRVLITTDWYEPVINGVVTSVMNLSRQLRERGHEVKILTLSRTFHSYIEGDVVYAGSIGLGCIYPQARLKIPKAAGDYMEMLLEWKPDIVHSQCEFSTFFLAKRIASELHVPIVHTYHTVYEDYTHYFSPQKVWGRNIVQLMTKKLANVVETLIAPSDKIRKILEGYQVSCPVEVIPSGIHLEKYQLCKKEDWRKKIRMQLGISQDALVLVYVGRMAKEKNIEELLEYQQDAGKSGVILVLVGDGPYLSELKKKVEELKLAKNVIFTGMITPEEVGRYYQAGDLFVSASISETQGMTYFLAKRIASELHVPIVHTYHTVYEDYTHYFSPQKVWGRNIVQLMTKKLANVVETLIAPSDKIRKILEGYQVSCPVEVIPSGIHLEKYQLCKKEDWRKKIRMQLGISQDALVLVYVGRMAKEKNIEELLEYQQDAGKSGVILVLVGDGPYLSELKKKVEELKLAKNVIFTGMITPEEVGRYYQAGDLFVSASISETQGMTYAEALAGGIPLLCRRDGCLEQVVTDGENGWQYDKKEDYLMRIQEWKGMGENARSRMQNKAAISAEKFSSGNFAERVEKIYEQQIRKYRYENAA